MPKGEEWDGGTETFEEMMAESFPSLLETINSQIQKSQWISSTGNMKKSVPSYTIIKWLKTSDKDKILKAAKV